MTDLSRPFDAIELTQALIRCPSVTPVDAGALDVVAQAAQALGFEIHPLQFEEEGTPNVQNVYARWGTKGPNFCFAGHTDVVPVGEAADWSNDPFAATVKDGALHGRGAADMKGAIGAFLAAADRFISEQGDDFNGSISLLITGDEEGPAINGTVKMLDWLRDRGESLSHCLVGEPTNPTYLGEMMKVGRRGSIGGSIKVYGTQGHVAYPHLADNPVPKLAQIVARLSAEVLDEGTDHFQPSNLEFTSIDVGNEASNVIPASATARFNIRFNDQHTGTKLHEWLTAQLDSLCAELDCRYELKARISGESFLTQPGPFSDLIADSVQQVTGHRPDQSTTGGTSDARFITNMCPVCEFGLTGQTMHKVDEHVPAADITALADIYYEVLKRYFAWAAQG